MNRYIGKSKEITHLPNKPIPICFKAWVVAQQGFFLQWIWHQPGLQYGPVGIKRSRIRKGKEIEEALTGIPQDSIILNATQNVVVALLNPLPTGLITSLWITYSLRLASSNLSANMATEQLVRPVLIAESSRNLWS